MKKSLLRTIAVAVLAGAIALSAQAASRGGNNRKEAPKKCTYSPLQDVIRNARGTQDIAPIIQNKVDLNAVPRCGGTPLQLAVLRGNPQIVKALLEGGASVSEEVSLEGFTIPEAPEKVPVLMFAGFFAPRPEIVQLIIQAGADVLKTDENGENVLWYIEQNPVLRNTALSDEIKNALLFNVPTTQEEQSADALRDKAASLQPVADSRVPVAQRKQQPLITKTADGTVGISDDTQPKIKLPDGVKLPDGIQVIRTGGGTQ